MAPERRVASNGSPGGEPAAVLEASAERLEERLRAAAEQGGECWRRRMRLGLAELLSFAAEEPEAARALLAGGRGGGAEAALRREETMERLAACIEDTARRLLPSDPPPSPLAAAAVVGGIERILQTRLRAGGFESLGELLPSLMYVAVLHFEGREAAERSMTESGPRA